jgi:hypothetical protein
MGSEKCTGGDEQCGNFFISESFEGAIDVFFAAALIAQSH